MRGSEVYSMMRSKRNSKRNNKHQHKSCTRIGVGMIKRKVLCLSGPKKSVLIKFAESQQSGSLPNPLHEPEGTSKSDRDSRIKERVYGDLVIVAKLSTHSLLIGTLVGRLAFASESDKAASPARVYWKGLESFQCLPGRFHPLFCQERPYNNFKTLLHHRGSYPHSISFTRHHSHSFDLR